MEFPRIQYGRRTNKQFNYIPRVYDPAKEDLDERVQKARAIRDKTNSEEDYAERIRKSYKSRSPVVSSGANKVALVARLRIMMIAVILGLMFYLVFYTDVIYVIFGAFSNA
jgi:hypothetical protein